MSDWLTKRTLAASFLTALFFVPLVSAQKEGENAAASTPKDYILGPGDTLSVWALGVDELAGDRQYVVLPDGSVDLPLVGHVAAVGRSVDELKRLVRRNLSLYFREPQVSVGVTGFKSQPISVLGAVRNPGVFQLQGGKSLLEVVSMAGGATPEADSAAMITRLAKWGPIPVAGAGKDSTGQYYTARVDLDSASGAKQPALNIRMMPDDVVEIPKAQMVYVLGEVSKPGAYALHENESLTAVQAVSMAGGPTSDALPQHASLLRTKPGSARRVDLPIDLKKVLQGKSEDMTLKPEDIVYVPGTMSKKGGLRALENRFNFAASEAIGRR